MAAEQFEHFEDITPDRRILGAHANADGQTWFTKRRTWRAGPFRSGPSGLPKLRRPQVKPGSGMIATATGLLFLLGAGLLGVSLAAQYRYLLHERHQHWASLTEALALDVGMLIFSLLALGLARAGKPAKTERLLIIACAAGSAVMNYAAADVTSPRSVLAYVMPPIFLAVVADRVISVVRRHYLGDTDASAWQAAGRAAGRSARFGGLVILYGLRLALAPRSTLAGGRRAVLLATPLPVAEPPRAIEPPAGPRAGTKTAAFLSAVIRDHGPLSGIALEQVSPIAAALAPGAGLNTGTARKWLRRAVLAAQAPEEASQ